MYIKPPLYCRCRFRGSKRKHVTVACKYLQIKLWNKFDLFSKEERATAKSVGTWRPNDRGDRSSPISTE